MNKERKDSRGNEDLTSIFRSKEVKAFLLLPTRLHVVIDGVWSHWEMRGSGLIRPAQTFGDKLPYKAITPTWANLNETVVLDEDGVTGEVAMDDGRLTGVQVTVTEGTRVNTAQKASQKIWPLKEKPPTQMLSSPEGGQYLCAPAFPGLSDAKAGIKEEKRFLVNLWSEAIPPPFRSWSCGFSLSFSRTASGFLRTCTLWWKWPAGKWCHINQGHDLEAL